jgi:hypothetical protein
MVGASQQLLVCSFAVSKDYVEIMRGSVLPYGVAQCNDICLEDVSSELN